MIMIWGKKLKGSDLPCGNMNVMWNWKETQSLHRHQIMGNLTPIQDWIVPSPHSANPVPLIRVPTYNPQIFIEKTKIKGAGEGLSIDSIYSRDMPWVQMTFHVFLSLQLFWNNITFRLSFCNLLPKNVIVNARALKIVSNIRKEWNAQMHAPALFGKGK